MYYIMNPFLQKIQECFRFTIKCYGIETTIIFIEFYTPINALLYTLKYYSETFILKHLKGSNMFRSHSDHLKGAHIFLIKVTDFKIC